MAQGCAVQSAARVPVTCRGLVLPGCRRGEEGGKRSSKGGGRREEREEGRSKERGRGRCSHATPRAHSAHTPFAVRGHYVRQQTKQARVVCEGASRLCAHAIHIALKPPHVHTQVSHH
eukprot:3940938-Rhodomonas_salina.3